MKIYKDTSRVQRGAKPGPWHPLHSCFLPLSLDRGVGFHLLIDTVSYSFLRCYLITHSHLDHVNGLVLSAGSMSGQKLIHARKQTIKDLEVIFADRLWPKLASHKKEDANAMLVYSP